VYRLQLMTLEEYPSVLLFLKYLNTVFLIAMLMFFGLLIISLAFKKGHGCNHTIYILRRVVDSHLASGSTVNICALDVTKTFDKMNHHRLFIKLIDRGFPNKLLLLFEKWFNVEVTCVK